MHKKLFYCLGTLLLLLTPGILSDCNICVSQADSDDEVACLSENTFQYCVDGEPTGPAISCPANYKCGLSGTCKANLNTWQLGCNGCKMCSESGVFACLTTTTFALCEGGTQYSSVTGTCKSGTYCNRDSKYICGYDPPTCSFANDPEIPTDPPVPSPITKPLEFCEHMGEPGRYPIGTDQNTTCRQYLRCIENDGEWMSAIYKCPSGTYFDSNKRLCGIEVPQICQGNVNNIQIANMRLS